MTNVIESPDAGAPPKRRRGSRLAALLTASLLAMGTVLGGSVAANAAGETVSVATYTVQQGAYQTFTVGGLAASSTYTAVLSRTNTSTAVATKTFSTNGSGVPTDPYLRMTVSGSATIAADYEVYLRAGASTTGSYLAVSSPSISVVAPNTTASITSATVIGSGASAKVRVVGIGFRRTNTAYNSVIGVKLDEGGIQHADSGSDKAPVPKPYPTAGSSPANTWYYIGSGNITSDPLYSAYNGATGYPNAAYASGDIVGGSFTVDIPIGSISSGAHSLRFLTGSLWNTPWQSTGGADVARSISVSFTK